MKKNRNDSSKSRVDSQIRRLEARIEQANRLASKGIRENVAKFSVLANAAERDLKKLRGVGKGVLRAFRTELKKSWKDLRRVAHEQF